MIVPPDPIARQARVLRGVLAASFATLTALAAHVAGGGAVPSPALVGATMLFAWLPGIALIGRRPVLWRQSATILVAQAMLHGLFLLEATAPAGLTAHASAAMPGMAMPSGAAAASTTGMTSSSALLSGWSMWAAHGLAAVLTIAAWRHGESVLRAIARCVLHAVRVTGWMPPRTPSSAVRVPITSDLALRGAPRAAAGVLRRGPPRVA